MKFTIVEPHDTYLSNYPNLGIAYIAAGCRREGIKIDVVQGSTRYLHDILIKDSDELIQLINTIEHSNGMCNNLKSAVDYLRSLYDYNGEQWFQKYLRKFYEFSKSDSLSDYLNEDLTKELNKLLWSIFEIYRCGIREDRIEELMFTKRLYQEIIKKNPDIVGFSLFTFLGWENVNYIMKCLIEKLKEDKDVPVVVGGPFTIIDDCEEFAINQMGADFVIRGDALQTLPKFLQNFGSDYTDIKNVSFKRGSKLIRGNLEFFKNLDALPTPDFSDYNLDGFFSPARILPVIFSRGCYWGKCAFCLYYKYGDYNTMDCDRFIEIVDDLKSEYNTHLFALHDNTLSPKKAEELSNKILEAGSDDVYFYSNCRMKGFDKRLLNRMHKAGFRVIFWGLESGSQNVLDLMQKGTTVEEMKVTLKNAHDTGISNLCFQFFGFPGETRDDAEKTREFIKENARYIDFVKWNRFFMMKDSPIEKNPAKWGVRIVERGKLDGYCVEDGMQPDEVRIFMKEVIDELRENDNGITYAQYTPSDYRIRGIIFVESVLGRIHDTHNKDKSRLYPMRSGFLKKRLNQNMITHYFFKENATHEDLRINNLEADLYQLMDGRLSVSQIISETAKKHSTSKGVLKKTAETFLDTLIEKGFVTLFKTRII